MLNKRGERSVEGGTGTSADQGTGPGSDMPPSNARIYRAIVFPFLILAFLLQGQAKADKVDQLIKQLQTSDDYKVRLSAALNLAKTGDERAIGPFIKALGDSDKTVRGVAAASLGKLVTSSTPKALRDRAISALKTARDKDSNAFVRKQAGKAYDTLKALGSGGGAQGGAGGIYVDVSGIGDKTGSSTKMVKLMERTINKTFQKNASTMMLEWPGGGDPSKAQLTKKGLKAFHVSGTLTSLTSEPKGAATIVGCKLSMLLATYPEKSMFAFAESSAKVQATNSARDIGFAKEDCVNAVVEDLVKKKIIPTIKMKAGAP